MNQPLSTGPLQYNGLSRPLDAKYGQQYYWTTSIGATTVARPQAVIGGPVIRRPLGQVVAAAGASSSSGLHLYKPAVTATVTQATAEDSQSNPINHVLTAVVDSINIVDPQSESNKVGVSFLGGGRYALYQIRVSHAGGCYLIKKRFSQFWTLHAYLHGIANLLNYRERPPSKTVFRQLSLGKLEKRKQALNNYLAEICSHVEDAKVAEFLAWDGTSNQPSIKAVPAFSAQDELQRAAAHVLQLEDELEQMQAQVSRAKTHLAELQQIIGANILLSVRYDVNGVSPYAQIINAHLRDRHGMYVYNPNFYTKKHCGSECCLTGYGCKKVHYMPPTAPTDDDCWQTSYRWHMEFPELWGKSGKAALMLVIREGNALGHGQITEKKMAQNLGILRLEIEAPKIDDLSELPEAIKVLQRNMDAALREAKVI